MSDPGGHDEVMEVCGGFRDMVVMFVVMPKKKEMSLLRIGRMANRKKKGDEQTAREGESVHVFLGSDVGMGCAAGENTVLLLVLRRKMMLRSGRGDLGRRMRMLVSYCRCPTRGRLPSGPALSWGRCFVSTASD